MPKTVWRRRLVQASPILAVALGAAMFLGVSAFTGGDGRAHASEQTRGTIPSAAIGVNGAVDKSLMPDYIEAIDQSGSVVGYVAKDLAVPDRTHPATDQPIPVYDGSLLNVVGYMVPGRGYVPKGVPEASVHGPAVTVVNG